MLVFGLLYTSTNVLWIRNCSAYSESVMSRALGELAGNQRLLQQRAAGGCHDRTLTVWPRYGFISEFWLRQSMHIYLNLNNSLPYFIQIRF